MLGVLLLARLLRPGFALALEAPAAPFEGFASGAIDAP
jgi:hypothetical protein